MGRLGAAARRSAGPLVSGHSVPAGWLQRRWYTPPSKRRWSVQHYRIRSPRPLVDRFDISREQPQKEWWRERPVTPATFFGFPDVTKHGIRGGSLYVEQMDSVTLAVLADKCIKEGIVDPEIWTKFCWRAQQIASRTFEPDLCYVFRAFSRMDWFDQNFLTTYLGRLQRRLHALHLPDVAVLLEAFANPRFRLGDYFRKALLHLALLLQHRDDAKVTDLARCCAAMRALRPLPRELWDEVVEALELLAEALLLRELSDLSAGQAIRVIDCYSAWGLLSQEGVARSNTSEDGKRVTSASKDLCWALVRELRGKLRDQGRESPDDLATLALTLASGGLDHDELWKELVHNLEHEAYRLSGKGVCAAIWGAAKAGKCTAALYDSLARRLAEERSNLSPADCALAFGGFLRGPAAVAERAVLRGPVGERVLELGLSAFSPSELADMFDGLSRAPADTWGVEAAAGAMLEALHERLGDLQPEQLASVTRSLGYLRPESQEVLVAILDRAQAACTVDVSTGGSGDLGDGSAGARQVLTPRRLAMLCQGIAQLPLHLVPDGPARLEAMLPHIGAALACTPSVLTTLTLFASLARCPASEQRGVVLDACAERLARGACNLPAASLVSLSAALAAFVGEPARSAAPHAWAPPEELLRSVQAQLDIKRYDLGRGALSRAAAALEAAGAGPGGGLRLEARDRAP